MPNLKDKPFQSSPAPSNYLVMIVDPVTGAVKKMTIADFLSQNTTPDTTPPSIVSATVLNGTTIRIIFSEIISAGTIAGWSTKKNGTNNPIVSVLGVGSATLDFTVTNTILAGDTILISYNPAAGGTTDSSGNEANTITDYNVTNSLSGGGGGDTTAPTVVSATVEEANKNQVRVTFSESVPTLTTAGWSFKKAGVNWPIVSVAQISSTLWVFTMTGDAAFGETLLRSYNAGTGNTLDAASNELGSFTDSSVTNNVAGGGGYDADAQALFTAAGITDTAEKDYWNSIVVAQKGRSTYSKIKVAFPLIGSDPAKTAYDAISKTVKIAWTAPHGTDSLVHDAMGVKSVFFPTTTTATGYGLISFSLATLASNSYALHFYRRDNSDQGNAYVMGLGDAGADNYALLQQRNAGVHNGYGGAAADGVSSAGTDSRGLWSIVRTANNDLRLYRNGVQIGPTITTVNAKPNLAGDIGLFAYAVVGGGSPLILCAAECAFAAVTDGLTPTEVLNFYTDVQAGLAIVGRNV